MNTHNRELIIGILGMPDNVNSQKLIDFFSTNGLPINFIIYWQPSIKDQYKRVINKLKNSGVIPTMQRIYYAFTKSKHEKYKIQKKSRIKEFFVRSHNSTECQEILRSEKCDILLLATDAIITTKILAEPRLCTLNGHPGWIPQFRGLGSTFFQLESGKFPAISIHKVDEGIDTGPLILREQLNIDPKIGLSAIEEAIDRLRHELFLKVINMFQKGDVEYQDTFEEPSNITRGMALKRKKELDKKLRSGEISLTPFE